MIIRSCFLQLRLRLKKKTKGQPSPVAMMAEPNQTYKRTSGLTHC
jgi:hypothetical protein